MIDKIIEYLVGLFLIIFLPVQVYIALVGGVILLDTLLAVFTIKKGEWSWKRFWNGLKRKVLIYPLIVVVLFHLDAILMNEFIMSIIPFEHVGTKAGVFILLGKEFNSIINHFNKIFNTNLKVNAGKIYNKIKELFKDIKSWFK